MSKHKTEVKCAIEPEDAARAMAALGFSKEEPGHRHVWFFDDDARALFERGIILRARRSRKPTKVGDFALKARGDARDEVDFSQVEAVTPKRETDWTLGLEPLPSISATWENIDRLDEVLRGESSVAVLAAEPFVVEQALGLVAPMGPLLRYGPISSYTRKDVALAGVSDDVTIEVWELGELDLVELSLKVSGDPEPFGAALLGFCAEHDVRALGRSKTRFALERLVPFPLAP